ncbi:MAG: GerW family sporulation protein, partial [Halanaerobiales bacterium]
MDTAMSNIKCMIDVNTIVGDAVETMDGTVIIPVSKVSFGFAAGGGEFTEEEASQSPFAGGSGAGVMLSPVAFLVVGGEKIRLLPVTGDKAMEKLLNIAPDLLDQIGSLFKKGKEEVPPKP